MDYISYFGCITIGIVIGVLVSAFFANKNLD